MKNFLIAAVVLLTNSSQGAIYHLISKANLESRTRNNSIYEPGLETEGFTHNCTLAQIVPVANRHYKGVKDTVLLEINESLLQYPLRFDYSEKHKEYFPHIYGPINLSAVVKTYEMLVNSDGTYRLPEGL